jgi:tRNA uridine 5-carbamoylmethylation protein Kti12
MNTYRKVMVLSGCSGSGKSTFALELGEVVASNTIITIVSADSFFVQEDESYAFDPAKLGEAHGACFRAFMKAVMRPVDEWSNDIVIVDNTNTSIGEITPYWLAGQAYGWDVAIVRMAVPEWGVSAAAARNVHGVSEEIVRSQWARSRAMWLDMPSMIQQLSKGEALASVKDRNPPSRYEYGIR